MKAVTPLIAVSSVCLLLTCATGGTDRAGFPGPVLDHALSLTDSMQVDGEMLCYIHIYADAPDYQPVEAAGEGITCVDDVGRFMEVLEYEILENGNRSLLPQAEGMTRFLLRMVREDGLWYNFMYADGSVNAEYRTSLPEFQWWAVRGLRGLVSALNILEASDPDGELLARVLSGLHTMDPYIDTLLMKYDASAAGRSEGRADWLLRGAPDVSSEWLGLLCRLHGQGGFELENPIRALADGLVLTQYLADGDPIDGMYFCWENTWHNWGNNQSSALLRAYEVTGDRKYLDSVIRWADSFIPTLLRDGMRWEISIDEKGEKSVKEFPQIAYGIHAMYSGMKMLSDITGESRYRENSDQILAWFTGVNAAGVAMYDAQTGRCYDGINGPDDVNYNSGAESTIECLLALQENLK